MAPARPAPQPWVGSAAQLHDQLTQSPDSGAEARELLKSVNNCGTYLRRLESTPSPRVTSVLRTGTRVFTVRPSSSSGGTVEQVSSLNAREEEKGVVEAGDAVPLPQTRQTVPPFHHGRLGACPTSLRPVDGDPSLN